ncbi:flagellar export chaperone FliS [Geothrix sp. PMB-07]|uniref:flagellar export chaperone FliS n=1 Tax=Geothrix sp. PMB-07 TaxID=3068640 RepID=UPI0027426058|nr:flagellar export chaperone FliS [Geothrix sp. PMB-07]WLT31810.1 flagellar export chaperone FliS [Geothrix sp. PMB-07]
MTNSVHGEGSSLAESGAIPEHVVVLLLEAAQRFLVKLEEALPGGDPRPREYFVKKLLAILDALHQRLNHEAGGELVGNLIRLYAWWGHEIIEASDAADGPRLKRVCAQMGDIRQAWEKVLFQGEGMSEGPSLFL